MKTLLINGSPKKDGNTAALVGTFLQALDGEVKQLTPASRIAPCADCRYCWTRPGCAIDDEMQEVYPFLRECDNVVLASPIWFSSLSGPLLTIASRVQTLFAARAFRGEQPDLKQKNGVIILTGAEPGTEKGPLQNAMTILKHMNVRRPCAATVYSLHTNQIPAAEDEAALQCARDAAKLLNHTGKHSGEQK